MSEQNHGGPGAPTWLSATPGDPDPDGESTVDDSAGSPIFDAMWMPLDSSDPVDTSDPTIGDPRPSSDTEDSAPEAATLADEAPANKKPVAPEDDPSSPDFNPFAAILGNFSTGTTSTTTTAAETDDADNPLLAAFGAAPATTKPHPDDASQDETLQAATPADEAPANKKSVAPEDDPSSPDFNPFAAILGNFSTGTTSSTTTAAETDDADNPLLATFGAAPTVTSTDDTDITDDDTDVEQAVPPSTDVPAFDAMWTPFDDEPAGSGQWEDSAVGATHAAAEDVSEPVVPHDPVDADADDDFDDIEARAAALMARLRGGSSRAESDHPEFVIPTLSDEPLDTGEDETLAADELADVETPFAIEEHVVADEALERDDTIGPDEAVIDDVPAAVDDTDIDATDDPSPIDDVATGTGELDDSAPEDDLTPSAAESDADEQSSVADEQSSVADAQPGVAAGSAVPPEPTAAVALPDVDESWVSGRPDAAPSSTATPSSTVAPDDAGPPRRKRRRPARPPWQNQPFRPVAADPDVPSAIDSPGFGYMPAEPYSPESAPIDAQFDAPVIDTLSYSSPRFDPPVLDTPRFEPPVVQAPRYDPPAPTPPVVPAPPAPTSDPDPTAPETPSQAPDFSLPRSYRRAAGRVTPPTPVEFPTDTPAPVVTPAPTPTPSPTAPAQPPAVEPTAVTPPATGTLTDTTPATEVVVVAPSATTVISVPQTPAAPTPPPEQATALVNLPPRAPAPVPQPAPEPEAHPVGGQPLAPVHHAPAQPPAPTPGPPQPPAPYGQAPQQQAPQPYLPPQAPQPYPPQHYPPPPHSPYPAAPQPYSPEHGFQPPAPRPQAQQPQPNVAPPAGPGNQYRPPVHHPAAPGRAPQPSAAPRPPQPQFNRQQPVAPQPAFPAQPPVAQPPMAQPPMAQPPMAQPPAARPDPRQAGPAGPPPSGVRDPRLAGPPAGGPGSGIDAMWRPPAVPSLDDAHRPNPRGQAPQGGWRRAVHVASSGHLNPGESRGVRRQQELLARIRQPLAGDFRVAVLSMKGGVGKTTTTISLGSAFASIRSDRVIAVDANPDRGTLADRVPRRTHATVRNLLDMGDVRHYADVSSLTSMSPDRLEVLASEQDPAAATAFDEDDYRRTIGTLQRFYNIILTDCGTGINHSAMGGVLDLAHAIVLVTTPAMDAARSASATLDWLNLHGHSRLAREAHVVMSSSRPSPSGQVSPEKIIAHFEARCRSIHLIPFDQHLAEGSAVDLSQLNNPTRQAYFELAGAVSESFGLLRRDNPTTYRRTEA
ncbi:AAA family ATPase [Gordonia sp. ABSL1-1]|uniref:nucleotide-binding protein n=1 Tax=Gordonia sp. ABSL1-1 TaxID=3053923 RepID=UPI002574094A|nr:AAA family ATPase [Gordonia sp. ABSL1-1]MDL9937762.1 AAA family ATPase [Gordonia sp. ABSL1-1]